jgi:hypothetical protein
MAHLNRQKALNRQGLKNECSKEPQSQYLMPGLDRIGKDLNGNPKIIKYGTREYTQPDQQAYRASGENSERP